MATYRQIQQYVHAKQGYTPETCWIAHVKELNGLPVRRAPNRKHAEREKPCPANKRQDIREALEHFGMLTIDHDVLRTIGEAEIELPQLVVYKSSDAAEILAGQRVALRVLRESALPDSWIVLGKKAHEEWRFSITSEFQRSISRLDKKLLGRILEAVTNICEKPTEPRSDTVKPLQGELRGKWRYRIGDYRLIYLPDEQTHTVYLLAMFPRGSAYLD